MSTPGDVLLQSAPCGVFSFNDEGIILSANPTFCQVLEFDPGEVEGKKVEQILTLASRIFYQTHFFPLLKLQGKVEEIFLSLQAKNKNEIPVLMNAKRVNADNSFQNVCAFIPVHQRRKYEEEILEAKKAAEKALKENKEILAAKRALEIHLEKSDKHISKLEQNNRELIELNQVISHDLQEPVRKIALFSDVLNTENKDLLTSNGVKAIERITYSAGTIFRLLNDLQIYVSIGMGHLKNDSVDLSHVFANAINRAKDENHLSPVHFNIEDLPVIEGDQQQLDILFYNLVNNAMKFHDPSRELIVQVQCSLIQHNSFKAIKDKFRYVDFVKIDIADNGIGFENQYKDYIFKITRKIDKGSPGLGFGLALSKKVVDNHFGSISAESEPGEGSRFSVLLPLKQ